MSIRIPFGSGLIPSPAPFGMGGCCNGGAFIAGGAYKKAKKVPARYVGKVINQPRINPKTGLPVKKRRPAEIFPGCVCQNVYNGMRVPKCYCRAVKSYPNRKGHNRWINFVHKWVDDHPNFYPGTTHGQKYAEAIRDPQVSQAYQVEKLQQMAIGNGGIRYY